MAYPSYLLRTVCGKFAIVAAFAAIAMGAQAQTTTPALPPASTLSDHWWIPEESGWGLSIVQHDDRLLFAMLFVYDEVGRAQWFAMPDMRRGEGAAPVYSGALYSTSGPSFGTTFDPASVNVQRRGDATLTPQQDGTARLRYSVDGTIVEKVIRRISVMNVPIAGTFLVRFATTSSPPCDGATLPDREAWRIRSIPGGYDIARAPFGGTLGAPQTLNVQQHGSAAIASFIEIPSSVPGAWVLVLDSVTGNSMTGKFTYVPSFPTGGCVIQGNFSAARSSPTYDVLGYYSDQWWDPAQSGWGMTVSHGSFGLFAVLFLYSNDVRDAQGRGLAQWFVMPEMKPLPVGDADPPPPPPGYVGTIYSTQGTAFSRPFDAAAVRLTAVGEARLEQFGDTATLTYRIGDRTVTRELQRFATAELQTVGRYRVSLVPNVVGCEGPRDVAFETWVIERAADGIRFLSRTDPMGIALGPREPVQVLQRGKNGQMRFTSPHAGSARNWYVNLDYAGDGGIGGSFARTLTDNSCYENGTFTGVRVPAS